MVGLKQARRPSRSWHWKSRLAAYFRSNKTLESGIPHKIRVPTMVTDGGGQSEEAKGLDRDLYHTAESRLCKGAAALLFRSVCAVRRIPLQAR